MIQDVLDRLDKVKHQGRTQWIALCPGHEDSKQSLSVGEGRDGTVLMHCHKGCSFKEIVTALGMNMKDFFKRNGRGYNDDYY